MRSKNVLSNTWRCQGFVKTHKMRDVENVLVLYYSIKEIKNELNKEYE